MVTVENPTATYISNTKRRLGSPEPQIMADYLIYIKKKRTRSKLLIRFKFVTFEDSAGVFFLILKCFNILGLGLQNHYPVLFRGVNGTVAHEFIFVLRHFKVN